MVENKLLMGYILEVYRAQKSAEIINTA